MANVVVMRTKYADWLWNLIFALFPVAIDMLLHWWRGSSAKEIWGSSDNIPALAFAIGLMAMSASADVAAAANKKDDDSEKASFTHAKNFLVAGAVAAITVFGIYEALHVWDLKVLEGSHVLTSVTWGITIVWSVMGCAFERNALVVLED